MRIIHFYCCLIAMKYRKILEFLQIHCKINFPGDSDPVAVDTTSSPLSGGFDPLQTNLSIAPFSPPLRKVTYVYSDLVINCLYVYHFHRWKKNILIENFSQRCERPLRKVDLRRRGLSEEDYLRVYG